MAWAVARGVLFNTDMPPCGPSRCTTSNRSRFDSNLKLRKKRIKRNGSSLYVRAIMIKHMGDLWAAQVAKRPEADDSEVMEDLKLQWNDMRKFTPRMPT